MFRKTLIAVGISALIPFTAAQANNDGAGCGLGKVILEGKSGAGINIAASLLNNLIVPQTSAMTSGTMGCDTSTVVQNDDQQREVFVASNIDNLSVDAAQGQGNYLASLAQIMKIQDQDIPAFYSLTQDRYESIFVETTEAKDTIAALDTAMASDTSLSKYIQ